MDSLVYKLHGQFPEKCLAYLISLTVTLVMKYEPFILHVYQDIVRQY